MYNIKRGEMEVTNQYMRHYNIDSDVLIISHNSLITRAVI